jgi:hypothetical protein
MHAPPKTERPGLASRASKSDQQTSSSQKVLQHNSRSTQPLFVVASVPKSETSQLRLAISHWRGENKLELRETTRLFGETFYPAGTPLWLPIERLPEFIEATIAVEREAIARGLLPANGRAA